MCTVSNIGDEYARRWTYPGPQQWPTVPPTTTITLPSPISRAEFDALKLEVEEMKRRLIEAKEEDRKNGEPDCEMADKVAVLKKVAELVGVDLSEVFGDGGSAA